ncbi:MAG: energy transducer TonB [Bacteroidales bacterium]|nr:energy transducer TonB [Bacteroidales bacterium]
MKFTNSNEGNPSKRKVNLDKDRGLFFQIGLVVSLSLVLLAFEWKSADTYELDWDVRNVDDLIEEMTVITLHKKKVPQMPKPTLIPVIKEIENFEGPDEDLIISAEITENTYNELDRKIGEIEEIVEEDTVIHVFVSNNPEFPGGEPALMNYLRNNLKFTQQAREINLQGTVYVSFVVWNDGSIRNIKILRGLGAGLDEEVIRVIEAMPPWTPGSQNGRNVNVEFKMPVKFQLN